MIESKVASTAHPPKRVVVVVDDVDTVVVLPPPKASLATSTAPSPTAIVHRVRTIILMPPAYADNAGGSMRTKVLVDQASECGALLLCRGVAARTLQEAAVTS
jgi:hypothetical protein